MDGLVSNFALVAGVIGGGASDRTIVLTGLAGLAAGAFSMAVGEYTSVATQTEATLAEIEKEKSALLLNPVGETKELASVYRRYGVEEALAHRVAEQITAQPDVAWRVHVREELGVDPDDLPSPYVAACSSFALFAIGALIPILPFLLGFGALEWVVAFSAVALLLSGGLLSRLTLRSPLFGGLRQLSLGLVASGGTFLLGHLVGSGLG
jgi:VIT1/CCC1 family predicted Fe2+/Mn2+ transporter